MELGLGEEAIRVVAPDLPAVKVVGPGIPTVSVVAVDGPPGPAGPPGDVAGQLRLAGVAAVTLSGHRAVTPRPDGTLDYASNDDPTQINAPVWLTLGAAVAGAPVDVLVYGFIVEPSWSWDPGPIYLGVGGLLTQIPPDLTPALFLAQVGFATGPTTLFFDQHQSIALT